MARACAITTGSTQPMRASF